MKTPAMCMAAWLLLAQANILQALDDAPRLFEVSTVSGENYKNSRVIKVTPADLTVMHEGGVAKIPFEQLGAEWQEKFNFDPAKAEAFRKVEVAMQKEAEAERRELHARRERAERETMAKLEAEEKRLAMASAPAPALIPFPGEEAKAAFSAQSNFTVEEEVVPTLPPLGPVHDPAARFGRVRSERWSYSYGDGIYGVEGYYPPYLWNGGYQYQPGPWCPPHQHHHHHGGSGSSVYVSPTIFRVTR